MQQIPSNGSTSSMSFSSASSVTPSSVSAVFDPKNATYMVEGSSVTLVNGMAVSRAVTSGSAETISTTMFGEPVVGDLNGDGVQDAAVMLEQNSGGTGAFYYEAAALNVGNVAKGTNAVLLGDRIAPQTTQIANGQIVVNYADRNPGEPMTTQPSLGVSKFFSYDGSALQVSRSMVGAGGHCGGNNMLDGPTCMTGYHCAPDAASHLPFGDVGGTCIAN